MNSIFLDALDKSNVLIPDEELASLSQKHGKGTLELAEALVREGYLTRDLVCKLWSDSINTAYVDPLTTVILPEAIKKIPRDIAVKAQAIPTYILEDVLTVCMADPHDTKLVSRLEAITKHTISPVFSLPSEINDAIDVYYSNEQGIKESITALEKTEGVLISKLSPNELATMGESESVIKICEALLYLAIKERTSDIHLEPMENETRVRFRIDGRLQTILYFTKAMHQALKTRIKILCKLNIAESRFPQDGRFSIPLGTNKVAFRVSFIPAADGEKVVIRILASTNKRDFASLDQMLISQTILQPLHRLVQSPNGIIFVTGPTGSGKTTTLYAALHEINKEDVNICTIEDPIELRLPGLIQSQVNDHIDLNFSRLLRALLRQDPDVILVGEIRDLETAKIATEAALTGHLVLSTLHTNNAVQAIIRLVEIGIPAYMVAPSILGVLAQRLAARICDKCKESYFPSEEVLNRYFSDAAGQEVPFFRGSGCENCRDTGYKGRIAFHELVLVTEQIRSLISQGAELKAISDAAAKVGYMPLRYDGLKKVLLGLTTINEIEKLAAFEWAS